MKKRLEALTILNQIMKAKGMIPYELEPIVWNFENFGISAKEFLSALIKYTNQNNIQLTK